MLEFRTATYLDDVDKAYTNDLLKRTVGAIRPGETDRIWGSQSFERQLKNN